MGLEPDIRAVLDRHFATGPDEVAEPMSAALDQVLSFAGLDPARPGPADKPVIDAVIAAMDAGLRSESMVPSAQAYARGLGRIVAAESDNYRRAVKDLSPEDRAAQLDRMLEMTLPTTHAVFQALHLAMLRRALEDALSAESLAEPEQPDRVISLVDLCQSTPYLATADRTATRELVDALYEAGRAAEQRRAVWTVKYVGDGVFLVGRDAQDVAEASLDAIEVLERRLPLRARAGLACGPVVRRAGDYFGPVVNLASRLTTVAAPSTVVAAEPAANSLDDAMVSGRSRVKVRGFDGVFDVAILNGPRLDAAGRP